jgi:uncharacterized phage protein (TIGR02220 family)
MSGEKKSFVLYTDLSKPVKSLSNEDAGKLFKAIFEYQNGGVEQELSGSAEMAFIFVKQQLDRNQDKYNAICERNRLNGLKGGRPEKAKEPSGLSGNPKEPKKADNDNESDNKNDKEEKKVDFSLTDTIIDYFNKITGQKRKHMNAARKPIHARLSDEFTKDDCFKVISTKYDEWKDNEEMEKYITIETFFRPSNFEKYLNQPGEDFKTAEQIKRQEEYRKKIWGN